MQEFLQTIIKQAGEIAKPYFLKGVTFTTKAHQQDMVTEADISVSKFLVEKIHEKYPDHHIKSEELPDDINSGAEFEWVIDPIDGTRNFAIGIPLWAVMIAVLKNGELYMSAVYHPIANELFFAQKGKGAFLNGIPVHVNKVNDLERSYSMIFRAIPGSKYGDYFEVYKKAHSNFALHSTVSMMHFSCSAMLTYVAKGSVDFAVGNSGMDWDYLPTFLICEEAGATVTNCEGKPWTRGRQDYIIANPHIYSKVFETFSLENPTV